MHAVLPQASTVLPVGRRYPGSKVAVTGVSANETDRAGVNLGEGAVGGEGVAAGEGAANPSGRLRTKTQFSAGGGAMHLVGFREDPSTVLLIRKHTLLTRRDPS